MDQLSKHELVIWEEALQLYNKSVSLDLEHDAHAIFRLAVEAAKRLTIRYQHPLALQLAKMLTGIWCDRWYAVNGKAAA